MARARQRCCNCPAEAECFCGGADVCDCAACAAEAEWERVQGWDDGPDIQLADPEVEWQNHPERAPDWYYPMSEPVSSPATAEKEEFSDRG